MTIKEAIKIMEIERTCVLRQDTPECNRDECGCQCCDLVQEPDDVVAAYGIAIKVLKAQEQPKVEEATEEISNLLKTGYFKARKKEIKDLEENAASKQYLEICKKVAEKYPEKEVKKKGMSDYLADDPSLTQQVGAEELGLADVRENRTSEMMTLDEAIKHADGIAIEQENFYNPDGYECITKSHKKCAAEHRQLAEWLKELKRLKEKEEPKKVLVSKNAYGWEFYHCPLCEDGLYDYMKYNHCPNCGQALKWEEKE